MIVELGTLPQSQAYRFMTSALVPRPIGFLSTCDAAGLLNIREIGEFVFNVVTEEIVAAMNLASGDYPPEVDEFALAGLTPAPSQRVRPPRVAESPVQLECRAVDVREVGRRPSLAERRLTERHPLFAR